MIEKLRAALAGALAWFTLPKRIAAAAAVTIAAGGITAAVVVSGREKNLSPEQLTQAVSLSEEAAEPVAEEAGLFTLPALSAEEVLLTLPTQARTETQPPVFTAPATTAAAETETTTTTATTTATTVTTATAATTASAAVPATTTAPATTTLVSMPTVTAATETTTRAPTTARSTTVKTTTKYVYTQSTAKPTTTRTTTASRTTASTASTTTKATTTKQTYIVTFVDDSGIPRTQSATVTGTSVNVTSLAVTAKTGWTIRGWTASMEPGAAATYASRASIPVSDNITYYAVYEQNVKTYTFNTDGGTATPNINAVQRISYAGGSTPVPVMITMPPAPVKASFSFVAWEDTDGNRYSPGQECLPDKTALRAVWI